MRERIPSRRPKAASPAAPMCWNPSTRKPGPLPSQSMNTIPRSPMWRKSSISFSAMRIPCTWRSSRATSTWSGPTPPVWQEPIRMYSPPIPMSRLSMWLRPMCLRSWPLTMQRACSLTKTCVRRFPMRWTMMRSRPISAAPMLRSPTGALYPPPRWAIRTRRN